MGAHSVSHISHRFDRVAGDKSRQSVNNISPGSAPFTEIVKFTRGQVPADTRRTLPLYFDYLFCFPFRRFVCTDFPFPEMEMECQCFFFTCALN